MITAPPAPETSPVTPQSWHANLDVPDAATPPTATPYDGSAVVTWSAPGDGGAVITDYLVRAYDDTGSLVGETCAVEMDVASPPALECTIENLTNNVDHTFDVIATNAVGDSLPSAASAVAEPRPPLGDPPPPPTPASAPFYAPPALVDIDLADAAGVSVSVPGYIAIPQGRIHIDNPHGHEVDIIGGILAAQFDVTDARASGPQSVDIGFVPLVVQRKVRIVTTNSAGAEASTAIVQINQNGAYAINSWQVQ